MKSTAAVNAAEAITGLAGQVHDPFELLDELHRRQVSVSSLSEGTGGELERSARYRDIHVPNGIGDEMRILFRTGEATWATACVGRADEDPNFDEDERAWLRAIAPEVGRGL